MSFRFRAFALHLLASFALLALILVVLYVGWYRWPGWYLLGAEVIVALLVLVDLGIGPVATLVVSNPHKPRAEWRRDIGLIIVVQIVALGYGAHALWVGRPLFYVYSLERIELVRAADLKDERIGEARRQGAVFLPEWNSLPKWVWAPLPSDSAKRAQIMTSAILGGDDVVTMPQYFRPWLEGKVALDAELVDVDRLANLDTRFEAEYRERLSALNRQKEQVGALPVRGMRRDGTWIFDRDSGKPLAFWPVVSWALKNPNH